MKKFGIGLIAQVGIKLLAVSLGFFTTRWLIQNLDVLEYEAYNLITTYNTIVLMIVTFGIPNIIQKHYTNHSDESEIASFWTSFSLLRLASYFIGILIILFSFRLSQTEALLEIILIFTGQFILLADLAYRSVCDAKGHSWQFSLTDFGGKLLLVILLFLVPYLNSRFQLSFLNYFALVSIFSYTVFLLIDSIWQRKYTPFGPFQWNIVKQYLPALAYLSVSGLIVATFLNTDRLFLKYFGFGPDVINGYSNAYKLFEITSIVPGLTMPPVASLVKKFLDQGKLTPLGKQIQSRFNTLATSKIIILEWTILTSLLGLLSWLALALAGGFVLGILDPEVKYNLAWEVIPYLAWSMIPMTPMLLYTNLIIFLGGERQELIAVAVAGLTALIGYLVLIPSFSLFGAAIATGAMYSIALVLKGWFLLRVLSRQDSFDKSLKMS